MERTPLRALLSTNAVCTQIHIYLSKRGRCGCHPAESPQIWRLVKISKGHSFAPPVHSRRLCSVTITYVGGFLSFFEWIVFLLLRVCVRYYHSYKTHLSQTQCRPCNPFIMQMSYNWKLRVLVVLPMRVQVSSSAPNVLKKLPNRKNFSRFG